MLNSSTVVLTRLRRQARNIGFGLLLATGPMMLGGCYGAFPITKAIYRMNGDVSDDKWVRSIVFWVLVIVPVYSVASFADAIVLNVIEFWTGDTIEVGSVTQPDGTTVSFAPGANANEAVLTVSRGETILSRQTMIKNANGNIDVIGMDGKIAGYAIKNADGSFNLQDASAQTIASLPAVR